MAKFKSLLVVKPLYNCCITYQFNICYFSALLYNGYFHICYFYSENFFFLILKEYLVLNEEQLYNYK